MKTLILIVLCSLITNFSYSQFEDYLGKTYNSISSALSDAQGFEVGESDDGFKWIYIEDEFGGVGFFFAKEFDCRLVIIAPKDDETVNLYIEYFNSNYVVMSKSKWQTQNTKGIFIDIILTQKNGEKSFHFKFP